VVLFSDNLLFDALAGFPCGFVPPTQSCTILYNNKEQLVNIINNSCYGIKKTFLLLTQIPANCRINQSLHANNQISQKQTTKVNLPGRVIFVVLFLEVMPLLKGREKAALKF
jgi:hypothetical protein